MDKCEKWLATSEYYESSGRAWIRTMDLVIINLSISHFEFLKVGTGGIEPPTSVLSGQRSTTELRARIFRIFNIVCRA